MWLYLGAFTLFCLSAVAVWRRVFETQIIYEFQKGLLYRNGRLERVVGAGRYRFLKRRARIDVFDMRNTQIVAPGQSILTKDNVNVKITVSGLYAINDPVQLSKQSANHVAELYDVCQLALRDVVAATTIDELLEKKTEIDAQLLERVAEKAGRIGVAFSSLALRDIILPANLKRAFGAILEAQKEAQRQLEAARGEQAVLRSLANSAKMYENNPALLQARLIQTLSSGANTIVYNNDEKALAVKTQSKPAE